MDEEIQSCTPQNFTCRARCACNEGYYGTDCSLSKYKIENIRTIRESLCFNLYSTLDMQDLSIEVISQRASSVSELIIDPLQITFDGFLNCSNFILDSVSKSPYNAASDDSIYLVFDAISKIIDGDEYNLLTSNMHDYIAYIVELLSENRRTWLVVGEQTPQIITRNVRIKNIKDFYGDVLSQSYEWAESDIEAAYSLDIGYSQLVNEDTGLLSFSPMGYNSIIYSRNLMVYSSSFMYLRLILKFIYLFIIIFILFFLNQRIPLENRISYMIAINYEVYDSNFNAALLSKISVLNNFEVNYTTGLEVLINGNQTNKQKNIHLYIYLFIYLFISIYIFVNVCIIHV